MEAVAHCLADSDTLVRREVPRLLGMPGLGGGKKLYLHGGCMCAQLFAKLFVIAVRGVVRGAVLWRGAVARCVDLMQAVKMGCWCRL